MAHFSVETLTALESAEEYVEKLITNASKKEGSRGGLYYNKNISFDRYKAELQELHAKIDEARQLALCLFG